MPSRTCIQTNERLSLFWLLPFCSGGVWLTDLIVGEMRRRPPFLLGDQGASVFPFFFLLEKIEDGFSFLSFTASPDVRSANPQVFPIALSVQAPPSSPLAVVVSLDFRGWVNPLWRTACSGVQAGRRGGPALFSFFFLDGRKSLFSSAGSRRCFLAALGVIYVSSAFLCPHESRDPFFGR